MCVGLEEKLTWKGKSDTIELYEFERVAKWQLALIRFSVVHGVGIERAVAMSCILTKPKLSRCNFLPTCCPLLQDCESNIALPVLMNDLGCFKYDTSALRLFTKIPHSARVFSATPF